MTEIATSEITILAENGEPVTKQNPFQVDGDSVYVVDIDFDNSDFSDWSWDPENLFQSPFSASIVNSTGSNPKQIILSFCRTIKAQQIWLGENNWGDFSNVKISLLWSGGAERSIYDESADDTKRTSLNVEFEDEVFNSILIEFNTTDEVGLSNITIQKARYNTAQIQGKDENWDFQVVWTSPGWSLKVKLQEYQWDAFGRLRVSEPFTIFDASLTTELASDLYWSVLTNGTATGIYDRTTSSYLLSTANTGDYCIRQTKQRWKYQPWKSHEVLITWLFNTEPGQIKRVWLLDYDNIGLWTVTNAPQNWICLTNNAWVVSFCIYNNGVLTESVDQDNRNIDKMYWNWPSSFVLDVNAANIFFVDMEWLGVGAVRCWFVSNTWEIIVAHQFRHASTAGFVNVYMRTANLPVSYSITSTDWAWSMKQICSSVISEGGFNPQGTTTAVQNSIPVSIDNNDNELLIWIRLKEDSFEYSVNPTVLSILSTSNWNTLRKLLYNPSYTWSVTRNDHPNSEVQVAENNNNNITDDWVVIAAWSFANNTDSLTQKIDTALRVWKHLDWSRDEIWLTVRALGNESYYWTINFKELI